MTKSTNALAGVSRVTYDAVGNVLTETDPGGKPTKHEYDGANREIRTTLPKPDAASPSPVKRFEYNPATGDLDKTYLGTTLLTTDRLTEYFYDNLHRLVTQIERNPGFLDRTTSYTHDYRGFVSFVIAPNGSKTGYQYNFRQQLSMTHEFGVADSPLLPAQERTRVNYYDDRGLMFQSLLVSGAVTNYDAPPEAGRLQFDYTLYDYAGRTYAISQMAVNSVQGATANQVYNQVHTRFDAAGNLISSTDPLSRTAKHTYDGLNRVTESQQLDSSQDILTDVLYAYDSNGNLISSTNRFSQSTLGSYIAADDRTTTYEYDVLNRPTRATDPLSHSNYTTYDAVGNVLSIKDALGNLTKYEYDDLNRRTRVTDAEGHFTRTVYDVAGSVTAVIDASNQRTNYQYDSLNQRRKEILTDALTDAPLYDAHSATTSPAIRTK